MCFDLSWMYVLYGSISLKVEEKVGAGWFCTRRTPQSQTWERHARSPHWLYPPLRWICGWAEWRNASFGHFSQRLLLSDAVMIGYHLKIFISGYAFLQVVCITICRLVWITWRIQGNHRWCTVAPTSSDQCNDQCNLCVDKVSCFLDLDLNELVLNFAAHLDDPKLCHRNSLSDPQTKKHKKFQNFDLLNFKEGTKIWMRLCVVI